MLRSLVGSEMCIRDRFTFGFGRFESLAGFLNAAFLVFIALSIVLESVERIYDPPHIEHQSRLLLISVLGLLVNMVGVGFFHEFHTVGHSHSEGSGCPHSHGGSDNMRGVFLHVVADMLGSLAVIVSSLLIKYRGCMMADPAISFLISVLIGVSVWPLLRDTGAVLVQSSPISERVADQLLERVSLLEGVLGVRDPHFWTCLLYTSDAADEEDSVDLGGRRIIKKKKNANKKQ
eukprot:TRINITY_DN16986_c0_g1_i1.p1 TRINITY_DN16986_c0_g1~~TRINITY_DN16986_c0_g1_i1.p1  ORF type:complete len:233 (-),score=70.08 TRINITY_DN16986_c0_g1_i1:75-773(-)